MLEIANASIRIASTFIPIKGFNILLPNACIDEVFPVRKINPIKQTPPWCLGFTSNRNKEILVVSLESIETSLSSSVEAGNFVIALKKPSEFADQLEIGILADKIPHVLQADNYSLDIEYNPAKNHKLALSYVKIKDKHAFIPDIKRLFREYVSQCF